MESDFFPGLLPHGDSDGDEIRIMKIAIAGTGGLARNIAHYLHYETQHQFIILSRAVCITFPYKFKRILD
jgi:shikimate 5-dehydrogenase